MRFIIYGAGGVGGVIGAELLKAGEEVVLIARGSHLEAIRQTGLRYKTPTEDSVLDAKAVGDPSEISFDRHDVVLLTTKSQQSEQALIALRDAAGSDLPIICCQNGVDNERMALRRFQTVYAMSVWLPAQFLQPGCVECHASPVPGILDLGVYPRGLDARCAEIARRLECARFSSRPTADIMKFKYAKLLVNLKNALEAIVHPDEPTDQMQQALKGEAVHCFEAADIDWARADEVDARMSGLLEIKEINQAPRLGSSSTQSLVRGTGDIEADFLNGEISLLGRLFGIATPANTAIQQLANDLARRKDRPRSMSIKAIEKLISTGRNDL